MFLKENSDKPQIFVRGLFSCYQVEHLCRIFYPGAAVRQNKNTRGFLLYAAAGRSRSLAALRTKDGKVFLAEEKADISQGKKAQNLQICRLLYGLLKQHTGLCPPWGMLTGVRPVNLLRKHTALYGENAAKDFFCLTCDVSGEKYQMAKNVLEIQKPILSRYGKDKFYSLYVSIPFCPSRCAYCSFVSRTIEKEENLLKPYLEKLEKELELTAKIADECALQLCAVYIGGGTPTVLAPGQLKGLLGKIGTLFKPKNAVEYTVEAGRPDCTSLEKLQILKDFGVGRISINPQTFCNEVLGQIGRRHSAEDVYRCFEDARKAGHNNINMDLIAGLPKDSLESFEESIKKTLQLCPENITLHTLTLKRASDIVIMGQKVYTAPQAMLQKAAEHFAKAEYAPYYLYRQKSSLQNLDNTGWCRPGTQGVYNICIMEEAHSILAIGAGASTKLVQQGGKSIKRVYNHKLPLEYIENFEQILERKKGVKDFYACNLDTQTPG